MSVHGLWTGQTSALWSTTNRDAWYLDGSYTNPPDLELHQASVGSIHVDNFWSGDVTVWGYTDLPLGIHVGAFSGFGIAEQPGSTVTINGNSSIGWGATFTETGDDFTSFNVDGTLGLHNAKTYIGSPVGGTGNIVEDGRGTTEFGFACGPGDTIWCLEGSTSFDRPQFIGATIEGLGDGIALKGISGPITGLTLTATDFTFTAGSQAYDLHIHDTLYHQIVWRYAGGPGGTGQMLLSSQTNPVGALPQYVVHQT